MLENGTLSPGAPVLSIIAICAAVVIGTGNIKSSTEANLQPDEPWTIAGRLDHVHFIVRNLALPNHSSEILGLLNLVY